VTRVQAVAAALVLASVTGPGCDHSPTNQAAPPALTIECAALPASGPAPLSVAFGLDVKNAVGTFRVSLSYGDGTEGTDPDARHVYSAAGSYVASITVTLDPSRRQTVPSSSPASGSAVSASACVRSVVFTCQTSLDRAAVSGPPKATSRMVSSTRSRRASTSSR